MEDGNKQLKTGMTVMVRAVVLMLATQLCVAVLLPAQTSTSGGLLGQAVVILILAVMLLPSPGPGGWQRAGLLVFWALLASLALLPAMVTAWHPASWGLVAATALLICLFGAISWSLALWLGDRRVASQATLGALFLGLSLPLWSAPLVALFGASKWLVDGFVALCPISLIASAGDIDYLRGDWFYRHTPYGGLRYDYPDPTVVSLGILLLLLILLLSSQRLSRRFPLTTTSPVSEPLP